MIEALYQRFFDFSTVFNEFFLYLMVLHWIVHRTNGSAWNIYVHEDEGDDLKRGTCTPNVWREWEPRQSRIHAFASSHARHWKITRWYSPNEQERKRIGVCWTERKREIKRMKEREKPDASLYELSPMEWHTGLKSCTLCCKPMYMKTQTNTRKIECIAGASDALVADATIVCTARFTRIFIVSFLHVITKKKKCSIFSLGIENTKAAPTPRDNHEFLSIQLWLWIVLYLHIDILARTVHVHIYVQ